MERMDGGAARRRQQGRMCMYLCINYPFSHEAASQFAEESCLGAWSESMLRQLCMHLYGRSRRAEKAVVSIRE